VRRASFAVALLGALAAASSASAHVVPQPSYVTADEIDTISLAAPNERRQPMTGFVVTAPKGIEVVHAHGPAPPWTVTFSDTKATWSGSSLPPGASLTFGVVLDAKTSAGTVDLLAEQLYPDGGVVRWPIALTVLPSATSPSQNLQLAAVVGLIGFLVVVAVVVLTWRVRTRSPAAR
jgi:uncharacterized protein YcnI